MRRARIVSVVAVVVLVVFSRRWRGSTSWGILSSQVQVVVVTSFCRVFVYVLRQVVAVVLVSRLVLVVVVLELLVALQVVMAL